jgi:2-polyprenyl-3-methyl-5-hydroxy-6-metoxy-1,4-benzoquinol methylase
MEKQTIKAPSAELRVTDLGKERQIMTKGKAYHHGKLVKFLETVDTALTFETIKKMVDLKGDWWLDEMERRHDFNYVGKRLVTLVNRFGSLRGKRILDIGSGSGSSALVMMDKGAKSVQGVEPNAKFVELAKMRARDEGFEHDVTFLQLKDTRILPFEDGKYDIVTFSAVIEHIPPSLRHEIIKEAYRCLAPGGFIVFTETPNRIFPYDGHTTGLLFIHWLPLALSYPIAKMLSWKMKRGLNKEAAIAEGLVGGSYWKIKKALSGAECLNIKGGDADWKCNMKGCNKLIRWYLRLGEWKARTFMKQPLNAWMPMLDLVFKKPE